MRQGVEEMWGAARRGAGLVALLVALSLAPTAVHATSIYEFTGAQGSTHPFTARTLGTGAETVYFNPALLFAAEDSFGFSVAWLRHAFRIDLDPRPAGTDISRSIYDARKVLPDGTTQRLVHRALPTDDLRRERGSTDPDDDGAYLGIGLTRVLIPEILAFGFYAVIPVDQFQGQAAFFPDEREQYFSNSLHFELYGDRMRTNVMSFALAGRPVRWLSLGAGLSIATAATVHSDIYIPDVSYQETTAINADLGIELRFIPHFALAVEPGAGWRAMATVHLPYQNDVDGSSDLQFWNYPYDEGEDSIRQEFSFASGFEPLRVAAGLSWEHRMGSGLAVAAALEGRFEQWSRYHNRHRERPQDAWSDTFSGSAGGTLTAGAHSVALDLLFVPSPVPMQNGRSNYVDNTRAGGALGWEWTFRLVQRSWRIGAMVQLQRLLPRRHTKRDDVAHPVFDEFPESVHVQTGELIPESVGFQTNNPGYPGYSSEGWILGAGVHMKTAF